MAQSKTKISDEEAALNYETRKPRSLVHVAYLEGCDKVRKEYGEKIDDLELQILELSNIRARQFLEIVEYREVIQELVEILDHPESRKTIDSFTAQPARIVLAKYAPENKKE